MELRQLITWRTILLHVPSSLQPAICNLPVLNTCSHGGTGASGATWTMAPFARKLGGTHALETDRVGVIIRTGGGGRCSRVKNGRESGVHTFTEIFGLQGKLRRSCTWCANCRLASFTLPLEIWTVFPVSSLYWYCGSGDRREMAGDGMVGEG
jgi:hypothetical protein